MKAAIYLAALIFTSVWCSGQVVTDNFSGSGALSGNWTNTSAGGYDPCVRVSGTAQPNNATNHQCLVEYTGTAFTNDQYSQFVVTGNIIGSTGPTVRMTTSGNGYVWLSAAHLIYMLAGGGGAGSTGISCPTVNTGDTVRLSVQGITLTCLNLTTGLSGTGTNTTYATGAPGMLIDQRSGGTDVVTSFQAGIFSSLSANPALLVTSTTGNAVVLTGVGTAWTAGTPGTPTFTASGVACSITAQTVASATSATITVNAGGTQGTCTITDPSTSNTTAIIIHTPQTWYIRTDGGTATQCTGHTNAAYPGSGTGQACALNHPYWLMAVSASQAWRADYFGGDTVLIEDTGPYYFGEQNGSFGFDWHGAGINTGGCNVPNTISFNCDLPPLPSGSSAFPTKWLGSNFGSCHSAPLTGTSNKNRFNLVNPAQFVIINGTFYQMSLQGSQYVDVECIQMTQRVTCSSSGQSTTIVGTSKSGTTATYQWDNGGQDHAPLPNQFVNISGTTNGAGIFNGNNKQIATEVNSTYSITASQSTGSLATFTYTTVTGIAPANGNRVNISGTTNCGGAFNGIFDIPISGVTGSTFQVAFSSSSCGSAGESGASLNNSSGTFTIGGFASGTVTLAAESGSEGPYGLCGNATTGNDFGANGIVFQTGTAQGPSNLTLKDIGIEGFANSGVLGSHINRTTSDISNASYMKVIGNSQAGWNGDGGGCGTSCESLGTFNMDHIMMDFNGTAEVFPNGGYSTSTGLPVNGFNYGYAQQTGGYGDGFAMIAAATFTFNLTNSEANFNTQDGFDLLHMGDDQSHPQALNIFTDWAEGNMGQTAKIGGGAVTTGYDNYLNANCKTMKIGTNAIFSGYPSGWNAGLQAPGDYCRAGDNVAMFFSNGRTTTWIHNTVAGYENVAYDMQCSATCTGTDLGDFRDNIFLGFPDPDTGVMPGAISFNGGLSDPFANAGSVIVYNQWYRTTLGSCPNVGSETNCLYVDPLLSAESTPDTVNPNITLSSNVLYQGTTAGPATDYNGTIWHSPPSIGAFELPGTPTAATPTFSPVAGTYSTTQNVVISTTTGGATICYTTDGSTPTATTPGTCSHGTAYTTPVVVSASLTINAIATESGFLNSSVGTAVYVISPTAATPTPSLTPGTYTGTQSTMLGTSTGGAVICYTVDGSTPAAATAGTCSHGTQIASGTSVSIPSTMTIKALATAVSYINSSVASFAYVITPSSSVKFTGTITITGGVTIQP